MNLWEKYRSLSKNNREMASIDLELTDYCNLNCSHCYKIRHHNFMSKETFYKVLDEAQKLEVGIMGFNGGEPTLHPNFEEFAIAVLERGMVLSVVSNGTIIDPKTIKRLSKWKGIRFQISFYGYDEASFSKITGAKSGWSDLLRNIKLLNDAGFFLEALLLVRNDTVDHIPEFYEFLKSQGINVYVNPVMFPRENGDMTPLKYAISKDQYKIIAPYEALNSSSDFSTVSCSSDLQSCGAGLTSFGIKYDGEVTPCNLINLSLGNVQTDELKDILKSKKLNDFLKSNKVPHECTGCKFYNFCIRCPGAAAFGNGDINTILKENCRLAEIRSSL